MDFRIMCTFVKRISVIYLCGVFFLIVSQQLCKQPQD